MWLKKRVIVNFLKAFLYFFEIEVSEDNGKQQDIYCNGLYTRNFCMSLNFSCHSPSKQQLFKL